MKTTHRSLHIQW